jgi:hypothetical protein
MSNEYETVEDLESIDKYQVSIVDVVNTNSGSRTRCFKVEWLNSYNKKNILFMNKAQVEKLKDRIQYYLLHDEN